MPTLLGLNDMKQYVLPTGWDAAELQKLALQDGTTYDEMVTEILTALSLQNAKILADKRYGGLITVTTEASIETRTGTTNAMNERTENTTGDAQRGATTGHMLPLKSYDYLLKWTWDFLEKARSTQLVADIRGAIDALELNWGKRLLTRAFTTTENLVGAGYDVPFVAGTSGMTIVMTPPPYDGQSFASSHSHFDRKTDDATGWAGALQAGALHLREHGLMGPYTAVWPTADVVNLRGLTGFVRPDYGLRYVRTDSGVNYAVDPSVTGDYIGAYETDYGLVYIWDTAHLPANYMGMYKSYGPNDPGNPLAVRYSARKGVGAILLKGEGFRQFPLESAVVIHEFGVGVNDRLNFYACEFDSSGSYDNPTIV